MRTQYADFDPRTFMTNFQSQIPGGNQDAILEMVRRISEQEAERTRKKKKAKVSAVEKLPVVKIDRKHCKKLAGANNYEPPSCTVCVDPIAMSTKGMFMPCGHIFHPDCLKPWLESSNTCPVCRYELPLEEPEAVPGSKMNA